MALFTKRHHEKLSERFRNLTKEIYNNECKLSYVVNNIATMLEYDNKAFDREAFLNNIYTAEQRKGWRIR